MPTEFAALEPPPDSPNRIALLPLAVSAGPGREDDAAELARGFLSLLSARLWLLPNTEIYVRHNLTEPDLDTGERRYVRRGEPWTVGEVLELAPPDDTEAHFALHGSLEWPEPGRMLLSLEVVDLSGGFPCFRHRIDEHPRTLPRRLFPMLAMMGEAVAPGVSTDVLSGMAYLPTVHERAFWAYLRGLARWSDCHLPVRRPRPSALFMPFMEAIEIDPDFSEACRVLDLVGQEYLRSGCKPVDAAVRALRFAIRRCERHTGLRATLGRFLYSQGQVQEAREQLETYVRQSSSEERLQTQAVLNLAAIYHQAHEPSRALKLLREASARQPADADLKESLGVLYMETGNFRDAEHCWRHVLDEQPMRSSALSHLGLVYWTRGESERAQKLLERSIESPDVSPFAYQRLLDFHLERGALDRADEVATEWVENESRNWRAWVRLAHIRRRRGQTADAQYCLDRAEAVAPRDDVEGEIAVARFAVSHPDDYRMYLEAIAPAPESPHTRALTDEERRAEALERLHDSASILDKLTQRHAGFAFLWGALTDRLIALEAYEQAVLSQVQVVTLRPRLAMGHNTLGFLLMRLGRREDAIVAFSRAVELAGDVVKYRTNLAAALIEEERNEEALDHLEAAHALSPDDTVTTSLLAEAERALHGGRRSMPAARPSASWWLRVGDWWRRLLGRPPVP